MQAGVMITNGGPHPADMHAETAADQIVSLIQIDDTAVSEDARQARRAKPRLREDLVDLLEGPHSDVIEGERGALDQHGDARYDHSHDAEEHHGDALNSAVDACVQAFNKYPVFKNAVDESTLRGRCKAVIKDRMAHAMKIERSWHKDLGGRTWRPGGQAQQAQDSSQAGAAQGNASAAQGNQDGRQRR